MRVRYYGLVRAVRLDTLDSEVEDRGAKRAPGRGLAIGLLSGAAVGAVIGDMLSDVTESLIKID